MLIHGGCRRAGVKRVRNVGGSTSGESAFGQNSGWNPHENRVTEVRRARDEDGMETVAAWACEPGCPVARLDEQSGVSKSGTLSQGTLKGQLGRSGTYGEGQGYTGDVSYEANQGGASRFFPQFADEAELEAWLLRLILGPSAGVGCEP